MGRGGFLFAAVSDRENAEELLPGILGVLSERGSEMKTPAPKPIPSTFMEELDRWTIEIIVNPLFRAYEADRSRRNLEMDARDAVKRAISDVQIAIRGKMLGHLGHELARNLRWAARRRDKRARKATGQVAYSQSMSRSW